MSAKAIKVRFSDFRLVIGLEVVVTNGAEFVVVVGPGGLVWIEIGVVHEGG